MSAEPRSPAGGAGPPSARPAGVLLEAADERPAPAAWLLGGLGLVLALAAVARATRPGPLRLGLAVACLAAGAGVAAFLPLVARLGLLAVTALALRLALPVAGTEAEASSAAGLLRQLGYFALPPLFVHLMLALRAPRGQAESGLSTLYVYAPMPVAFLAVAGYEALAEHAAAGGMLARGVYGAVYAVLLVALLAREVRAAASRPAVRPAERAATLEEQGRFGVAQRYYAQTERLDKAAEMAERAGEWARAAELYRRTGDPYRAAEMAFRAGRFEDTLELYEQAGAHDAAARVAERLGRGARAAELFERAGDAASAVRVLEAAGLRPSGDLFERADLLEKAVVAWQEEGHHARAAEALEKEFGDLEGAAQVYFNGGLHRRAAELFERLGNRPAAVAAWLASPDSHLEAARVCVEMDDIVRAGEIVADLPAEAREQLEDEKALLMLARVEERTGRIDEALQVLQKLRRRSSPPPAAFLPLGRCLHARGLVALAEENLRAAVEAQLGGADELEAHYLLGCVLEEQGRNDEAAEVFLGLMRKDLTYSDAEERYRRLKGSVA